MPSTVKPIKETLSSPSIPGSNVEIMGDTIADAVSELASIEEISEEEQSKFGLPAVKFKDSTKGVATVDNDLSLVLCLDNPAASANVVGVLYPTAGVDLRTSGFLDLTEKSTNFLTKFNSFAEFPLLLRPIISK